MSVHACPKCHGTRLTHNNGAESHMLAHGSHHALHGLQHGSPLSFWLGLSGVLLRLLNPRMYTCTSCGNVFKG